MINKETIYKKFEKRIDDYSENAFAQKKMAEKLVSLLSEKYYSSILEIGSYSGLLTSVITKKIKYDSYLALDVVKKSEEYLKKIDEKIEFLNCDMEDFEQKRKFDLIISNASLQWCVDFEGVIKKLRSMLKPEGIIAVSIFSPDNLREIKQVFGVSLPYPDEIMLKKVFGEGAVIKTEKIPLKFISSLDILRHLKYTGVNSLSLSPLSYKEIKERLERLNSEFDNTLTYCPVYVISKENERK